MQPFREVKLNLPGSLYLHSMPGKNEPLAACFQALKKASVDRIICLNPTEEIQTISPDYAAAVLEGTLPCGLTHFPIGNGGIADDQNAFLELARQAALGLQAGENILIHCTGGVGRTGMLASCVAAVLKLPQSVVTDAGGKAESESQRALIESLNP